MRALLLCAGLGTRLRPLTNSVPKCMIDINGRPLIDYWLRKLSQMGVKEVLINLHHLPDVIDNFIKKSNYSLKITTVYEPELLGTAGTLKKNRLFFQNDPVLLIHADNLTDFDGKEFVKRFEKREDYIELTMMTFETDSPEICGILELTKNGVVTKFYEKVDNPPSKIANGAVYIISENIIEFLSKIDKSYIDFSTEVIPYFMNKINTYKNTIYHRDIGTIKSLEKARKEYAIKQI